MGIFTTGLKISPKAVVDTNVPKTANLSNNPASISDDLVFCVAECVKAIENIIKKGGLVMDDGNDIFDKQNIQFLSFELRNNLFENMSISPVPFIQKGIFSLKDLTLLMEKSCFGHTPAEGLYLRHDDGRWVRGRAKIVRPEFIQTIDEHWSGKKIIRNQ